MIKSITGLLRYRFKLYYSILRCALGSGYFIYTIKQGIRFICHGNDLFSKIIYISNGHEKLEMEWACLYLKEQKKSCLVIDCGANIGYFSSYLAQTNPSCQFISIEGNERTFQVLQKTINKLKLQNISPVKAILSENESDSYTIPDIHGREPWQQAKKAPHVSIPTLTLDGILESGSKPCLVKIDCEGFEVKILKGATNLLKDFSTVFLVECNDNALHEAGTSREELFLIFKENEYKLFHLASFGKYLPPGMEIQSDFPSSEFNFVAIPDKPAYRDLLAKTISAITAN